MSDCDILWCGKYHQHWENEPHDHGYFQMLGILGGSGTVIIDQQHIPIAKEQIFLIAPQRMHAVHTSHSATPPLSMLDIKFTMADPALHDALCGLDPCLAVRDFSWFRKRFHDIMHESAERKPHYYQIIRGLLLQLLIYLIREQAGEDAQAELADRQLLQVHVYKGVDMDALMQYIQFNYANIISLDALAQQARVNKTTLIQIFKDLYGVTPIRFINRLRLEKAKELLINTDASISEIAELIGFQSIHYFSRFFHSKESCTALEYRARNTQSRFFTY